MKATDFVTEQLQQLVKNKPELKVTYEFNEETFDHYVQVEPSEFYYHYIDTLGKIWMEFVQEFPFQGLTFFPKDYPISVGEDVRIFAGHSFNLYDEWAEYNSYSGKEMMESEMQGVDVVNNESLPVDFSGSNGKIHEVVISGIAGSSDQLPVIIDPSDSQAKSQVQGA